MNDLIEGEDYFDGYSNKQPEPDNDVLDYQALTYRLFANEAGMKWLEMTKDVMAAKLVNIGTRGSDLALAEAQGMRRSILDIFKLLSTHQNYINSN